jgi:hypothetical protein
MGEILRAPLAAVAAINCRVRIKIGKPGRAGTIEWVAA